MIKNLSAMWETPIWSLRWGNPLEKGTATHSSILAWRLPWAEEPAELQSMGSQRVGHDWVTYTHKDLVKGNWVTYTELSIQETLEIEHETLIAFDHCVVFQECFYFLQYQSFFIFSTFSNFFISWLFRMNRKKPNFSYSAISFHWYRQGDKLNRYLWRWFN